jgi:hypothetical protein
MGTRVLVCGSRDYDDALVIETVLDELAAQHPDLVVVSGMARGADTVGAEWAKRTGRPLHPFPAAWQTHDREGVVGTTPIRCRCAPDARTCKPAGIRRNQKMLDDARPDLVVAFTSNLAASNGTRDMVTRSKAFGLEPTVLGDPA